MVKKSNSANGKLARDKGRTFELEVVNCFKPLFRQAKRHLEFQKTEAKGYDLDHTGIFKVQCKRGRKYAPLSKIKEVQLPENSNEIPLLVTKGDYEQIMVGIYLDDFMRLLGALKHKGKI